MYRYAIIDKCRKNGLKVFKNDNINSIIVEKDNKQSFQIKINNEVRTVTFMEFPVVLNKIIGYDFSKDNFNVFGVFINDIKEFELI